MANHTSCLVMLVLASACADSRAPDSMPMDPYSVKVSVVSDDTYGFDDVMLVGGLYTPIVSAPGVDGASCDASEVLHLAPWFRLNLSTGRSTLWTDDAPAMVVLPWYEGGVVRAESATVLDATLDDDGVVVLFSEAEFCLDGPSDSLFVLREASDDCEPIGEISIVVENLGDWSSPTVCNEAEVRADYDSCYVDARSARVDCP